MTTYQCISRRVSTCPTGHPSNLETGVRPAFGELMVDYPIDAPEYMPSGAMHLIEWDGLQPDTRNWFPALSLTIRRYM